MAYQPTVRGTVDAANSSTAALTASATFTGSFVDISVYDGVSVLVDGTSGGTAPGTLKMQFSHDGSTVHRSIDISVGDVAQTPPRTLGTVAQFFRVIYVNGGTAQTTFDLQTMFHAGQVTLVSRLDSVVGDTEDVRNVRSFVAGLDVLAGSYSNVSVASSTNDAGTYNALQVATGARPSQLPGRTAVRYALDHLTAPALVDQPDGAGQWATGETLYITDLILAVENSSGTGALDIYDGTTAAGTLVLPLNIADPVGGASATTVINQSLSEALAFTTGLFLNEADGVLDIAGVLVGYTE